MLSRMKLYVAGGVLLVILGLGTTIWIQSGRIDRLKAELNQERVNKEACLYANSEGIKTIDALQKEIGKSGKTCDQRLQAKDDLIKKLQDIDNLSGGNHEPNGGSAVAGTGSGNTDGDNALRSALNGMFPGQGSGEDGVHKAVGPESPYRAELLPGQLGYCLDEVNSRNLLKNMVLVRSWAIDLQTILTSLQTGTAER